MQYDTENIKYNTAPKNGTISYQTHDPSYSLCISLYDIMYVLTSGTVLKVIYLSLCALTNRCHLKLEITEFRFNMGDSAFVNGHK